MRLRQDLNEALEERCFWASHWLAQDFDPSFAIWFDTNIEAILKMRQYGRRIVQALVDVVQPGDKLGDLRASRFLRAPNVGKKTTAMLLTFLPTRIEAPRKSRHQMRFEEFATTYVAGWESQSGL